jgi:hypothetical protein
MQMKGMIEGYEQTLEACKNRVSTECFNMFHNLTMISTEKLMALIVHIYERLQQHNL